MSLGDLSSRDAVLQAIAEFDDLGRELFLRKYGFGPAREYRLLFKNVEYDSKAIVGAAHGHQFGRPLRARDFSGGDATVRRALEKLGFTVVGPSPVSWDLVPGDITTRSEISRRFGGSIFGGIEPSAQSPNVMLYTDLAAGARHGYNFDKWSEREPDVFFYTGAGQAGDQQLSFRGNAAIMNHAQQGKDLRLFEALPERAARGGKRQRYVGRFRLADSNPYRWEQVDSDTGPRRVLVFRLLAVPDEIEARVAGPGADADEGSGDHPQVLKVPSEVNTASEFEVAPVSGRKARRLEGELVERFESFLRFRGHETVRARVIIPGDTRGLVTDTVDETEKVLYEAKCATDRATIRLAVGQLLDYSRFLPGYSGSILLPERPTDDLVSFIHSVGFSVTYETARGWRIEASTGISEPEFYLPRR